MNVQIRIAVADDYDTLGEVMFDAVRNGTSKYSELQRKAWMPEPRHGSMWCERLDSQTVLVAEKSNRIVGFMSLADQGYIDFAYVRPESQGGGIFRKLFGCIEKLAMQNGFSRLWVHASLMAGPAFETVSFLTVASEFVEISGQQLERFVMEKSIGKVR